MGIYIWAWIYLTLFLFKWKLKESQKRILYLIGTFAIYIYIWGFRSVSVGTDTASYIKYFELYEQHSIKELLLGKLWFKQMEPAFIIMSKFIMNIVRDEYICLQVIGWIYTIMLINLLFKFKGMQLYWFGFAYYGLYLLCSGLNIMRQAIAILLLIYAFLAFRNNEKKKMLFFSVLACMIHYGAIAPIGIMFIFLIENNNANVLKMKRLLVIFGTIVGCFFFEYVLKAVGLGGYLGGENGDIAFLKLLVLIFIYLIYIFRNKINTNINQRLKNEIEFMETILILSIIMNIMGAFSNVFIRFTSFLIPYSCIAVTELVEKDGNKVRRNKLLLVGIYFLIMFFFFHSLINNIGGIVPFTNTWET